MTAIGNLARLAQTGTSLAIAGEGLSLANKKNKKPGHFIKTGMNTIVGTTFVRAQGSLISGL